MKKRVVKVLLPLLFSFCFVFSGFLSVNAFAADVSPNAKDDWYLFPFNDLSGVVGTFNSDSGVFKGNGTVYAKYMLFSDSSYGGVFPSVISGHRYLYYFTFTGLSEFDYLRTIIRSEFDVATGDDSIYPDSLGNLISYKNTFVNDTTTITGIIDFVSDKTIQFSTGSALLIELDRTINSTGRFNWAFYILDITDSSEDDVNSIIAAINNQTGTLQGSIGQAADDIQQSIEDQYSGDPETEFPVDDVITQHNEKMGVLSFGSDVMLQFLDMFQSANVGTAELTLPGFNIIVENVEYSVWPDYSFNFEQLNEWVPGLMSVIRMMLPAFVWLMVLRYCIKVFEDNFLAK